MQDRQRRDRRLRRLFDLGLDGGAHDRRVRQQRCQQLQHEQRVAARTEQLIAEVGAGRRADNGLGQHREIVTRQRSQ